jgi:hypothetical protein
MESLPEEIDERQAEPGISVELCDGPSCGYIMHPPYSRPDRRGEISLIAQSRRRADAVNIEYYRIRPDDPSKADFARAELWIGASLDGLLDRLMGVSPR